MYGNYFENRFNIIMMLYYHLQLGDTGCILKIITPNETFQSKYLGALISNTYCLVVKKTHHRVNKARTFVRKILGTTHN